MAKEKKKRATKYDEKLAINASFEDIIKLSADFSPTKKKDIKPKKTANKK
jgi:hypothetical protein